MDNQQKFRKIMKEWVIPVVLEIIVVLFFVKNVAFPHPGAHRLPGDPHHRRKSWLVATRIHNPEKRVERGTSSPLPDELDKMLIKRCIGLPGRRWTSTTTARSTSTASCSIRRVCGLSLRGQRATLKCLRGAISSWGQPERLVGCPVLGRPLYPGREGLRPGPLYPLAP